MNIFMFTVMMAVSIVIGIVIPTTLSSCRIKRFAAKIFISAMPIMAIATIIEMVV